MGCRPTLVRRATRTALVLWIVSALACKDDGGVTWPPASESSRIVVPDVVPGSPEGLLGLAIAVPYRLELAADETVLVAECSGALMVTVEEWDGSGWTARPQNSFCYQADVQVVRYTGQVSLEGVLELLISNEGPLRGEAILRVRLLGPDSAGVGIAPLMDYASNYFRVE